MNVPNIIYAGDTISWTESLTDYTLTASTLNLYFRGKDGWDVSSSSTSGEFEVTITADLTINKSGLYSWQAVLTDGTNSYTIGTGATTVKPSFKYITDSYDGRSQAQRILDNINNYIETREDVTSLTINGKSVTKMPLADVLKWRDYYLGEVSREKKAELIAQGLGTKNNIKVRFI